MYGLNGESTGGLRNGQWYSGDCIPRHPKEEEIPQLFVFDLPMWLSDIAGPSRNAAT